MSYLRSLRGCKAHGLRVLNFTFHFSMALMAGHGSNLLEGRPGILFRLGIYAAPSL